MLAWRDALEGAGIELSVWRIHRKIGMSGGLFTQALLRETGRELDRAMIEGLQRSHAEAYRARADQVRPLPGTRELLARLSRLEVPWAIATSGRLETAGPVLAMLDLPPSVPVVTRDLVAHAKPDPDLFVEAARRLGADVSRSVVVGDSVWDLLAARRANALG
ncbi:MAG: HAD family hydrolase, partial [Acidimicrobiia bacterium]